MDEQTKKRTRRTPQQMVEDADKKIEQLNQELETIAAKRAAANEEFDKKELSVKERIAALEQKKQDILAPKPQDQKAKNPGVDPERQQIRTQAGGDRSAARPGPARGLNPAAIIWLEKNRIPDFNMRDGL